MTPSSGGGWRRLCENCHSWRTRGQVARMLSKSKFPRPRSCEQLSELGPETGGRPRVTVTVTTARVSQDAAGGRLCPLLPEASGDRLLDEGRSD